MRKKWKGTARRCISILTSAIMILSLAAANGMAMTAYAEEADTLMESSQELAEGEISEGEISDPGGVTQPENEDESGEAEAPADELSLIHICIDREILNTKMAFETGCTPMACYGDVKINGRRGLILKKLEGCSMTCLLYTSKAAVHIRRAAGVFDI